MRNILPKVLAIAIGATLCGAACLPALAQTSQNTETDTTRPYIVRFDEPGLFHSDVGRAQRKVDVARSRATAVDAGRIDITAKAAVDYLTQLEMQQATHLAAIRTAIGRSDLKVTHHFTITRNGVSARLTDAEAARVAAVPGVQSVEPVRYRKPDTFRSPAFIGADTIWNGTAVPGGIGNRGRGQVLASLDTGVNIAHPSFVDDAACGFSTIQRKLLSALDCTTTDSSGFCNGPSPEETGNGHGTHTSGIAAGNVVTLGMDPTLPVVTPYAQISGVAPCAAVRTYRVCEETCPDDATFAAIDNLIGAADVTAVNYSISPPGGSDAFTNPWLDGQDKEFLPLVQSGIFVAASAGNTATPTSLPDGGVSHQGPWMMTVAASTHDEVMTPGITVTGPGAPPPNTQGVTLVPGTITPRLTSTITADLLTYPANIEGCSNFVAPDPAVPDSGTPGGGFPANYFAGRIALVQRGDCDFSEKVDNAMHAGAVAVVVYNNVVNYGTVTMPLGSGSTPNPKAWFIEGQYGRAMRDYIAANAPVPVTASLDPIAFGRRQGDVLARFSLRGPARGVPDITKPDITAPGVTVLAARSPAHLNYGVMNGTSIASPHIAGAAMLLMAAHPDWSPAEVKSALMLTAGAGYREDGVTPWTPDDVGGGRVHLERAVRAGFVMDVENYFPDNTARPSVVNQRAMNFASLRNSACSKRTGGCTWTRSLRDALGGAPSTWTATVQGLDGIALSVWPPTFSFNGDRLFQDGFESAARSDTQVLTITARPDANLPTGATWYYGTLTFTEANDLAPPAMMAVAVKVPE